MRCRLCGRLLQAEASSASFLRASDFDSCLFKCEKCKVGYSNAQNPQQRVLIHKLPEHNVPEEVRQGLLDVLKRAANEVNRESKARKFAFETSEDAVTWTAFTYLLHAGVLPQVLVHASGIADFAEASPVLLLWGAPSVRTAEAVELSQRLHDICIRLGENDRSRSEPDAIVDFGDAGCIFIEVKYKSPNDKKPGYDGFCKYYSKACFRSSQDQVKMLGYYELTRNWRIGIEMAGPRRFCMLNIVSSESARLGAEMFAEQLRQTERRSFRAIAWNQLLSGIPRPWPEWFECYLHKRGLLKAHSESFSAQVCGKPTRR